ncbi:hypothetical protein HNR03_003989 [Pseudomonas sp. JAI111]|uniref:hypothetical protein n=1 Tax=Pseudomonas sp. JAI111 TaxID=2735913 RepID=UPI00216737FA|nr:hypothetical protein [Pseudomonas sp. JAI111]MCS3839378.1 hypothetical protein [Pseudomonas sp. JAI111]
MPTNDFLPFGNAVGANVMTQADYLALAARSTGFSAGTAVSAQLNKAWRQSAIMAAVLGQFIADQSGQNAVDDGTTATLVANLLTAIRAATRQSTILTDTGTANTYAAANAPALTALPATGYSQRVNIANANTGASTYAPDGLAAKPIYGLGLQPLQGGELPVGVAVLMYLVQAGVNSGNGAWIVIESLGGASQVAPAAKSQHAVQLGQVGHGQCRLSVGSTTTLLLKPYNGNNVIVNGVPLQLPSAGVTYTASGLTASTLYYVYLGGTTAAPTLSLSTTGHSQAPNGVETKTGDTTLTLVGMVYTNASTQFIDSAAIRTCLNWFNRRKIVSDAAQAGPFSFTNTSAAETSSTLRAQFLTWADDIPIAQLSGSFTQSSGTPSITQLNYQIYIDGTVQYGPGVACVVQPTWNMTMSTHGALGGISEGYHYATSFTSVGVNGGTLAINNIQNSVNLFG